jgi:predicted site-specific integrase-resolvase
MTGEKPSANCEIKLAKPMTPQAAAAFLGLDEKTITRWARKAYLPGHPLGEGKRKYWRFLESELSDWLAAQINRDSGATTKEAGTA